MTFIERSASKLVEYNAEQLVEFRLYVDINKSFVMLFVFGKSKRRLLF